MEKATVLNITRFCTDDGPGIRTTVFLKGCPLSCVWCHNPESQGTRIELSYQASACVGCGKCVRVCPSKAHVIDDGGHRFDRSLCLTCGDCSKVCPAEALTLFGREMTVDEVFAEVTRDKPFYKTSGGGVTVSGGEPLARPAFTAALLQACREAGIPTAIETCGFASDAALDAVIPLCDLVLFDIKETDPVLHERFTGAPLDPILHALRRIDRMGVPVRLRLPIIPGRNDRAEHFAEVKRLGESLSHLRGIEIMPYHKMGSYKYASLGRAYACDEVEEPSAETVSAWRRLVGDTTQTTP